MASVCPGSGRQAISSQTPPIVVSTSLHTPTLYFSCISLLWTNCISRVFLTFGQIVFLSLSSARREAGRGDWGDLYIYMEEAVVSTRNYCETWLPPRANWFQVPSHPTPLNPTPPSIFPFCRLSYILLSIDIMFFNIMSGSNKTTDLYMGHESVTESQ